MEPANKGAMPKSFWDPEGNWIDSLSALHKHLGDAAFPNRLRGVLAREVGETERRRLAIDLGLPEGWQAKEIWRENGNSRRFWDPNGTIYTNVEQVVRIVGYVPEGLKSVKRRHTEVEETERKLCAKELGLPEGWKAKISANDTRGDIRRRFWTPDGTMIDTLAGVEKVLGSLPPPLEVGGAGRLAPQSTKVLGSLPPHREVGGTNRLAPEATKALGDEAILLDLQASKTRTTTKTPEASKTNTATKTPEASKTKTPEDPQTSKTSTTAKTSEASKTNTTAKSPEASKTSTTAKTPEASKTSTTAKAPEASKTNTTAKTPEANNVRESSGGLVLMEMDSEIVVVSTGDALVGEAEGKKSEKMPASATDTSPAATADASLKTGSGGNSPPKKEESPEDVEALVSKALRVLEKKSTKEAKREAKRKKREDAARESKRSKKEGEREKEPEKGGNKHAASEAAKTKAWKEIFPTSEYMKNWEANARTVNGWKCPACEECLPNRNTLRAHWKEVCKVKLRKKANEAKKQTKELEKKRTKEAKREAKRKEREVCKTNEKSPAQGAPTKQASKAEPRDQSSLQELARQAHRTSGESSSTSSSSSRSSSESSSSDSSDSSDDETTAQAAASACSSGSAPRAPALTSLVPPKQVWEKQWSENYGLPFWWNAFTQEAVWEKPAEAPATP
eukprot:TRINITY_DN10491_c0_g1_i1.p1 TRINITY_DN10491_c0_g1~~TRINITY_DN10491_c0_g1_i1.p1  ORF type:complete len:732 (-),score=170.04 TRINITY_DN10491_c0_g1_i1:62-2098(-)